MLSSGKVFTESVIAALVQIATDIDADLYLRVQAVTALGAGGPA